MTDNDAICFSRSTDNGAAWSPAVIVSSNLREELPKIAVDGGGNISVVWSDLISGDIYFSRSIDEGATWTQPINIAGTGDCCKPSVVVDKAGNINVVWRDKSWEHFGICFSRSINNGETWSPGLYIPDNSVSSNHPKIAVDSAGNINVIFCGSTMMDGKNACSIRFSSSTR